VFGGNKLTETTADTRRAIATYLILLSLSPNRKYVVKMIKTVFIEISAPTMPPLRPAANANLKDIVRPSAPRSSREPPKAISSKRLTSVFNIYEP
jgi:hypothetical protein